MTSAWRIEIAPTGYRSMEEIGDRKALRDIADAIDRLEHAPERQGKALAHPLEGLRSIRATRDRYRILYRVDPARRMVSVLLVARRKPGREDDVYALAQRLLKHLLR